MERVDLLLNGTAPGEKWNTRKVIVIDPAEWTNDVRGEIAQLWQSANTPLVESDSSEDFIFDTIFSKRLLGGGKIRLTAPSLIPIRQFLISFGWLAFYTVVSIAAATLSAYSFAHSEYLLLPAAILTFVSFTVLALIRLRIHVIEHRQLADEYNLPKAA